MINVAINGSQKSEIFGTTIATSSIKREVEKR